MARRPPRFRTLRAGPFSGVRDTKDATSISPSHAHGMVNCYAIDPRRKAAVLGRPGLTMTGAGTPLSAGDAVQALDQLVRLDGSRHTVAVCNGVVYEYDWGTDLWASVGYGGSGAVLATTGAVYITSFADALIFSDGTNAPFLWDGTTFTVLSNCPVLYGQPWVHAGRFMGIKASDGVTLAWSEPNQPNVGYEATISGTQYRNAWTLGQTARGRLMGGRGFNDRMILWRERSTTEVYGLVDSEWSTTATRESVSETVGLGAPGAVCIGAGACYWLNADGVLCTLAPGGKVTPIGDDLYESGWSVNMAAIGGARATFDPLTDLALVTIPLNGATIPQDVWPVHTLNDAPQGVWTGWGDITALATVLDPDDNPVRLHGGTDGRVYRHGFPRGLLWDDGLQSGTAAIRHVLRTAPLGWDETTEKYWDRIDLIFRSRTRITAVAIQGLGPYGYGAVVSADSGANTARWDEAEWDAARWAPEGIDQHITAHADGHGRWQQYEVRHAVAGEQFGLLTLVAYVQDVADYPDIA